MAQENRGYPEGRNGRRYPRSDDNKQRSQQIPHQRAAGSHQRAAGSHDGQTSTRSPYGQTNSSRQASTSNHFQQTPYGQARPAQQRSASGHSQQASYGQARSPQHSRSVQPTRPGQAGRPSQQPTRPGQVAGSSQQPPRSAQGGRTSQRTAYTGQAGRPSQRPSHQIPRNSQPASPQSSPNPKKGKGLRIVMVVAALVAVLSIGALVLIGVSYWQGQKAYDGVASQAFETPIETDTLLSDIQVDWDALRAINPDIVAWIYIPDSQVNYPVVHTDSNDTYLTKDFQGNEGGWWMPTYGTIFLTAENSPNFTDDNNIIQGHHLLNGSMFALLADMQDEAVFNAHRDIYLLTPEGNYHLKSFAIVHSEANEPIAQTSFSSSEAMQKYVQDKMDRNLVTADPAGPTASEVDQLFTLSTCDGGGADGHYVLFCTVEDYASLSASADSVNTSLANPDAAGDVESASEEITNETEKAA